MAKKPKFSKTAKITYPCPHIDEGKWNTRLALICQQQGQKAPKWQNNTKNTRFSHLNFQKQPKLLTPVLILMRANGIPVGDLKAGINLSATWEALSRKSLSPVKAYALRSPPTYRILVSKTDTSPL